MLPGEHVCNRYISLIKAHPHIQTFIILNNTKNLLPGKNSGDITRFHRELLLIRLYETHMNLSVVNFNVKNWLSYR